MDNSSFGREGIHQQKTSMERAADKFRTSGDFAATMEDHAAIGSTPYPDVHWAPGKAMHELLSDARIEEILDSRVQVANEYKTDSTDLDFIQASREELDKDIRYLRSVGRLPAKYEHFDPFE